MKRPWVQIAIDAREVDLARELTKVAIDAGADWIEVGTPLIVYQGIQVIRSVVEVAGGKPVVVDFKAQDGVGKYFLEAKAQGAEIATVLATMPDGSIKAAIEAREESGIQVLVDCLGVQDLRQRAIEVERLGADFLLLHTGFDEMRDNSSKNLLEGLQDVVGAVSIPVGIGTFIAEEAVEAIQLGASFVVQGEPLLSDPDPSKLSEFIQSVKRST